MIIDSAIWFLISRARPALSYQLLAPTFASPTIMDIYRMNQWVGVDTPSLLFRTLGLSYKQMKTKETTLWYNMVSFLSREKSKDELYQHLQVSTFCHRRKHTSVPFEIRWTLSTPSQCTILQFAFQAEDREAPDQWVRHILDDWCAERYSLERRPTAKLWVQDLSKRPSSFCFSLIMSLHCALAVLILRTIL